MKIKLKQSFAVEFFNPYYYHLFTRGYRISEHSDVSLRCCSRFQNGCFADMQIRNSKKKLNVTGQKLCNIFIPCLDFMPLAF